jgi:hypothetical protein
MHRQDRHGRSSFTSLRSGKHGDATVRRVSGRWQATRIEAAGARHAEPGDDRGGHGNDDGARHR